MSGLGLRDLARRLRYLPGRILHPYRRSRAKRRLRRVSPDVEAVVFVCHGNICRSPFAAAALREALDEEDRERMSVTSAGFHPVVGRRVPGEALESARRRGFDLSSHRSRSVNEAMDRLGTGGPGPIVFVMDADQGNRLARRHAMSRPRTFVLGDFDPRPVERRRIQDPFGHPPEVFEGVYDRIGWCVDEVRQLLGEESRLTTAAAD